MTSLITVWYDDRAFNTQRILAKATSDATDLEFFGRLDEFIATAADNPEACFQMRNTQEIIPERRDDTGLILRPGGADVHRDRYVLYSGVTRFEMLEVEHTREALAAQVRRLAQADLEHVPMCIYCKAARANGVCCSTHNFLLCHLCYRRGHFAEVCGEDCSRCRAEGLPARLSGPAATAMIRERVS